MHAKDLPGRRNRTVRSEIPYSKTSNYVKTSNSIWIANQLTSFRVHYHLEKGTFPQYKNKSCENGSCEQ